jgi:spermidine synthase
LDLWVTEYQTPSLGFACKVKETLAVEQTPFQYLSIVDTEQFGRMLLLDGMVMTTEKDEFVYHEMITQIALNSHPRPEQVLIIGGGDGGALREVVNHPLVEKGTLVEIDARVVENSKIYFPELSCSFQSPRAEVIIDDGISYVKQQKDKFDIIIIDSTEPVGPAVQLFQPEFYQAVYEALKEDGMLVAQSESPFFNQDIIKMVNEGVKMVFPLTKLYLAAVPTYPSGLWSFTVGSKKHDPELVVNKPQKPLKYYTSEIHQAAFKLPAFVGEIIG